MNERIRELMREADYAAPEIALRAQLLVELVIRECAEVADTVRPNYVGCGYITKSQGDLIREHFGVK